MQRTLGAGVFQVEAQNWTNIIVGVQVIRPHGLQQTRRDKSQDSPGPHCARHEALQLDARCLQVEAFMVAVRGLQIQNPEDGRESLAKRGPAGTFLSCPVGMPQDLCSPCSCSRRDRWPRADLHHRQNACRIQAQPVQLPWPHSRCRGKSV